MRAPVTAAWLSLLLMMTTTRPVSAAPATVPVEPAALPSLLVLKTRVTGAAAQTVDATTLTNLATTVLADSGRYKVSSYEDVVAMLDAEQQKQLAGCDDVSCMADIGNALGAQYLLYTQVGEAGGVTVVSASLIDAAAGKATERQSVTLQRASQVVDGVRVACLRLLGEEAGLPEVAATDTGTRGESSFDPMLVAWPALGVGAVVTLAGAASTGAALYFREQALHAENEGVFAAARDGGHTANTVALAGYLGGGALLLVGGVSALVAMLTAPDDGEPAAATPPAEVAP